MEKEEAGEEKTYNREKKKKMRGKGIEKGPC
jgi:hypothetical protein